MYSAVRRLTLGSTVLLAVLLLLLIGLASRPVAFAATDQSATVVRELTEKRTATSETYLLSDGSRRAVIYTQPVRFKDAAGAWQNFDTNLVPGTVPGAYKALRTPVALTVGALDNGSQGAQLASDGYVVTLTFLDAAGSQAQPLTATLALPPSGATLTTLGIAPETNIAYTALDWGVEQTLTLVSPAAPDSFRCRLSHPGLALARDKLGQWGLYAPLAPHPLLLLSEISVFDASRDASGMPAFCDGAAMTVKAGKDESTLTYALPRAWLSDPARVYPVLIDPTLTVNPNSGNSGYPDTCVKSQGSGSFGTSANLITGKDSNGYYWRSLLKFNTGPVPNGAYVKAATLSLRKWDQGASTAYATLRPMWADWSGSSTWSSLGFVVDSFPVGYTDSNAVTAPAWLDLDARSIVQGWKDGSITNYGFLISQKEDGSQGSAYLSWYRSADYTSGYWPKLVVDYDPTPIAAPTTDRSVYGLGETATVNVKAATYYWDNVTFIECGLNLTKADGSPYRGVVGWFRSPSLLPSASWHQVATKGDGSVFAYYSDPAYPSDYGADTITLSGSASTTGWVGGTESAPGYRRAGFVITFGAAFGSQVGVTPDTRFGMGPASGTTTTWVSGGPLNGGLSHPPASVGWQAQPGAAFSVIDTDVTTLTYSAQPSAWFDATSGPNDVPDQGRGAATLMWPAVAGASGYHIYANDGSGTYRQVGASLGGGAILWSSAGSAFYPKDSEIAALSAPYAGNPLYRAATPAAATLQSTVTPSPAPDPVGSPGSGVVLSDGTYLYEHRWGAFGGPTKWTRIGTGAGGTTLGTNYGPIPGSPDISQIGGDSISAFLLGGYLYNGATTAASASSATVVGVSTANGSTTNFTFTGNSPLNRATGASITANSNTLLLASASDAEGVAHIYSVAYTLTTNGDGSPRYDGYRVREYDQSGAYVADHVLALATGASEYIDGVLADGAFLYLITWQGDSPAHVTKISTTTWQFANQWAIDQATTRVVSGCYDAANNCFWLGALDANRIYRYAGSGGTVSPGFDLRDNPGPLYAKTANGQAGVLAGWTAYDFKVVPYTDAGGVSTETTPPNPGLYRVAATLDNRTLQQYRDTMHTETGLGSWAGHDASARLDAGVLRVSASDLAISSQGPEASVSRTYDSTSATAGLFAPGWRFGFERSLNVGTPNTSVTYTDEVGDAHTFTSTDGGVTWLTPNGYFAVLTKNPWKITDTDQSVLNFDSAGKLISEVDAKGNTTTYAYASGKLTAITAANGQQITLSYSGSKLSSAAYTVTIGGQQVTRQVTYATASPWKATYFSGKPEVRVVSYAYASSRLSAITQADWPQAGQSASESFTYDAGARLTRVDYPDYNATSKPDAKATIDYSVAGQATVYRYGRIGDAANTQVVSEIDVWDPTTKLLEVQTLGRNGAENTTTTFEYAANLQLGHTLCIANDSGDTTTQTVSATDAKGNLTAVGEGNGQTTYAYDAANNCTSETAPSGSLTRNTYDGENNLVTTWTRLNAAGDYAETATVYDAWGRVTQAKELISGTVNPSTGAVTNPVWNQTDYQSFAANGEPQTTIHRGVALSYGGNPQDLTEYATYDAFGNLLTRTDTSGTRVTETNVYDLAGRLVTQTDALAAVTHHTLDKLSNETESWVSAAGTNVKAAWKRYTYDALGRVLTETALLSDASGNPTTQSVVSSTWDGLGQQITCDDNTVGGQPAKWVYDVRGNVTTAWSEGVLNYTDATRSTRTTYDAENRVLTEKVPGDANAATSSYDEAGNLIRQTDPDGSWVLYTYDDSGNKTSETKPKQGYSGDHNKVAVTQYAYDLAGRLVTTTEPNGFATTLAYDQLGRQVSASGGGAPASTTTYNALGWVLRTVEADGVTVTKVYDSAGRLTSETKGSQNPTSSTYDECGRLRTRTDPDGRILENIYDLFGNTTREKHTVGGVLKKDILTVVDSLGRPASATDQAAGGSGLQHTWTYPVNIEGGVTETQRYDGSATVSTTISRAARGTETSRQTTYASGQSVTRTVNARDTADRVTQATYATNLINSWSYDAAGRLTRQWGTGYAAGAQTSDAYAYDPDTGQKVADNVQLAYGGTIAASYTYDGNGRLDVATIGGVSSDHTFDAAGNLTSVVSGGTTTALIYDSANRLTQKNLNGVLNTKYKWNASYGWRTSQGPSDASQPVTFTYTASGRLATYGDATRSLTATYSYDASGQRTRAVVTQSGATTTTDYRYDGLTLLGFTATQGSASWRVDYLYDETGTPYGAVYRDPASSATPTVFGLLTTDRGDVVELLDTSGAAFCAYRYDAWGVPTATTTQATGLINSTLASNIASRQLLRYASYCYDSESALYYCSARSYDPATRQWISRDPGEADGEESAYQYCGGEPVGDYDATGAVAQRIVFPKPQRSYSKNWSGYYEMALMINAGYAQAHLLDQLIRNPILGLPRTWKWWAWDMVRGGRPWDLKLAAPEKYRHKRYLPFRGTHISPEDFGNIHFGYTGRSIGLTLNTLRTGSFAADTWHRVPDWLRLKVGAGLRAAVHEVYVDERRIARGYYLYPKLGAAWGTNTCIVNGR